MITVLCVCVGNKYRDEDVFCLRRQVKRHLRKKHRFICLSDRERDGINCLVPRTTNDGWWAKLQLFYHFQDNGQYLYLDLDTVVVGDLFPLLSDKLSMPKNWAQSGHGGGQSSVMSWSGDYSMISDNFRPERLGPAFGEHHGLYGNEMLWGDQEFITKLMGAPGTEFVGAMPGVYSYKYHCRQQGRPPVDAKVIAFHGTPKPGDVSDKWVREARI